MTLANLIEQLQSDINETRARVETLGSGGTLVSNSQVAKASEPGGTDSAGADDVGGALQKLKSAIGGLRSELKTFKSHMDAWVVNKTYDLEEESMLLYLDELSKSDDNPWHAHYSKQVLRTELSKRAALRRDPNAITQWC